MHLEFGYNKKINECLAQQGTI